MSVIVFETEEARGNGRGTIEPEGPPTDAVTIEAIDVRKVVAKVPSTRTPVRGCATQ